MAVQFKPTYYDGIAKKAVEVAVVMNDRQGMAGTPYASENCERFRELFAAFGRKHQDPSEINSLGKALQEIVDLRKARRMNAETAAAVLGQLVVGIRRETPDYRFKDRGLHYGWEALAIGLAGTLGKEMRGSAAPGGECAVRGDLDLQGHM
jgi:hypothetical protein